MSAINSQTQTIFAYVIGAPGSGKGTLCKQLSDDYGICSISVGDLLRRVCAQSTPPPDPLIVQHVKEGTLIPIEKLGDILLAAIAIEQLQHNEHKAFIIDGVPRQFSQIRHMEDLVRGFKLIVEDITL